MAHLDPKSGRLTLHVVYDGAPLSGKTTTVRALAIKHGGFVETPEERDGRTTYFDWLDRDAGQFNGQPIQCRLIAVPGQDRYAVRRAMLLEAADVVIFIADTTATRFDRTLNQFENLKARLRSRDRKIPVLVQLNKRDDDGALDLAEVRATFKGRCVHCLETVAREGEGVQEMLALAAGAAIRALRESPLGITKELAKAEDLAADPASLLEQMMFYVPPESSP